ncbi:hypothetical protein K474DRAFT_1098170 [Panus rudis PR-1116 ss-1]|nr:hypothetical protein K474DRAFT_1098170 [Panus rudis PR-1116 ss-1]
MPVRTTETPQPSSSQNPVEHPVHHPVGTSGRRISRTPSLPLSSVSTNGDEPAAITSGRKRRLSQASHGKENLQVDTPPAKRARKTSSRLQELPTEIHLMILRLIADDDSSASLIRATHVCRMLRVTALSYPQLWTNVRTHSVACAVGFAQRSMSLELDVVASLRLTRPYYDPGRVSDIALLRRPELKQLRSLEIVASYGVMRLCLLNFPTELPSLKVLKLGVDSVPLTGNPPPVLEFIIRPANDIDYWFIENLELRNLHIRYPQESRHTLPHLRVLKMGLDPVYTRPAANHRFQTDEFLDLVEDCELLRELVLDNPGRGTETIRVLTTISPSLSTITFEGEYSCDILEYLTIRRSASVLFKQWDHVTNTPHPLMSHPAFDDLDTVEITFVSGEKFNRLKICAYTQGRSDGACAPLNISWDRSSINSTSQHLGSLLPLFHSASQLIVRQSGKISDTEWLVILATLQELRTIQITYYPSPTDIVLVDEVVFVPFLGSLGTLVTGGHPHPQGLTYVTFRGFESNRFTLNHTTQSLRTLRGHGLFLQRITIVQRFEGESEYVTTDEWTDLGNNIGIPILSEIDSELSRSIEA